MLAFLARCRRFAQRLGELPHLARLATADPVQRLDLERERLGVTGVEAVQPLSQRLPVQFVPHSPFHLRELVGGEQRAQLGVQIDDPLLRFLVGSSLFRMGSWKWSLSGTR